LPERIARRQTAAGQAAAAGRALCRRHKGHHHRAAPAPDTGTRRSADRAWRPRCGWSCTAGPASGSLSSQRVEVLDT